MDFNSINNYDGFQAMAAYHDTFFDRPSPLENDEFVLLHKYFKMHDIKNNKYLDVGCGTGDLCLYMANCGYNVTGLDFSDNMLLVARNKLALFKNAIEARKRTFNNPQNFMNKIENHSITSVLPKIKFIKDDITKIHNIKEQYNIITMINTLSYIDSNCMPLVFKNIYNSLYDGGYIFLNLITKVEYLNQKPISSENYHFDYEITRYYDELKGLNYTNYRFNESQVIKTPLEINFIEYDYSLSSIIRALNDCNFTVTKIIPNTPVYSISESDFNYICDAIESTYSMPNGVRSIIVAAQKT